MKSLRAAFLLSIGIALFSSGAALACSALRYPAHLGKDTLDAYDTIAVVRLEGVEAKGAGAKGSPAFSFFGRIIKPLKGPYKKGDAISGQTGGPREGAGCPIELLNTGVDYLLFFYGNKNPITLARYGSYYQRVEDMQRHTYVRDLEKLISKTIK